MSEDEIYLMTVANEFRNAFENTDLSRAPGALPRFPSGCCLWGSLFTASFLKDEGNMYPRHAASNNHPVYGCGHEWVVVNGIIIDITADQFLGAPSGVIASKESEWHAGWQKPVIRDFAPISHYDKGMGGRILPYYEIITSQVRTRLK